MKFEGRILIVGLGAVSRCLIPLLLRHIELDRSRITITDGGPVGDAVRTFQKKGLTFLPENIRRATLDAQLSAHVGPGDLVVDLATDLATVDIVAWCREHGVLYVNTSIEEWSNAQGGVDRTLLALYQEVREVVNRTHGSGPTAVVDHGANPGLVSHLTKQGLVDLATKWLAEHPADSPRAKRIAVAMERREYNRLAMVLGVKVIHISERDTQIPSIPKREDEFVNTWSVEAFLDESFAPAELSWGTHERELPPRARVDAPDQPDQLEIEHMGWRTWVRSMIPSGEIMGMVIRHSETFSIADFLTVERNGVPRYRPTVHYAYCPCDSAIASLRELQMRHFNRQSRQRILGEEIVEGRDELGVLLMGHDYRSWWVGSRLSIEETHRLAPGQNATTLQVACSALAATLWAIEHPDQGACFPEHLPHEPIIAAAKPYLGEFISQAFDWSPLNDWDGFFSRCNARPRPSRKDEWQFSSFLVPIL